MTNFDDLPEGDEGEYFVSYVMHQRDPDLMEDIGRILRARSELNGVPYEMTIEQLYHKGVLGYQIAWKPRKDTVKERLEEIQSRLEKASEGPWKARTGYIRDKVYITNMNGRDIASVMDDTPVYNHHDFIEHSREDIEWLIEELKKSRAGKGGY